MKHPALRFCILALLVFGALSARAEVTLPKIIGDNMVLQRGRPVPIWGHAGPGEAITVKFAGQEKTTVADTNGRWQIALDPLKASHTPADLIVAGVNTLTVKNILVGEVWFCSGQSNMEFTVNNPAGNYAVSTDAKLAVELKTETYPDIRLFRVEKQVRLPEIVTKGWTDCSGNDLAVFSAVGFFFARNLQRELGVPVGIVGSYWGGSRLEQWIPDEAFTSHAAFAKEAAAKPFLVDGRRVGDYYNSMIRDLAPFAVRGVLWYQGESNIIASNDGVRYADKMQALVDFWRTQWKDKNLPFYQVQIAPFLYTSRTQDFLPDHSAVVSHGAEEEPKLWEAQLLATRIPGVEIVPTTDLDAHFSNIHPGGKRTIGQRLTNLALAKVYGKTAPAWQGPLFDKWEPSGAGAVVYFTNTGGKLSTRDALAPHGFEVAGADGAFKPATATLEGDTVKLASPEVAKITAVRMGWTETAQPNLINKDGLPAYPFRTNGPGWKPAP